MKLGELTDVLHEGDRGLAQVTINRPARLNSPRGRTIDELSAGGDRGQQRGDDGPVETGLFALEAVHRIISETPKPVIAAVNGAAVGGGHVLH
jgi:2-ketocyclohexanecarboxyl-CoA hydrolase